MSSPFDPDSSKAWTALWIAAIVRFLLYTHAGQLFRPGGAAMVIDREFATDGHVIRLAVEQTANGWDVEQRRDATVVHVEHHDDWHRVERAMRRLEMEVLTGSSPSRQEPVIESP
jgi:hypothetical protein